ncbi:HD-GYP domain-containing protein [Salinivibrio sp. ES.052]|uniref:HD-GYP domain-containing protein n=1 Tax=Salinivibrio sp. ES.052 TaxID=1882823 RepID=UPI00092AB744|nr:HD domain-containing phosphohydrolase [Salinivibrio sp. ES.052]SIO04722.1 HDIG domain-containing protein [Salinivibrio sp. ES.052]
MSTNSIKLSTERLQAGLYIKLPLKWRDHPFMLNRFQIESDAQAKVIRSLPVSFVYYYPDKSIASPLPALSEKKDNADQVDPNAVSRKKEEMEREKQKQIEEQRRFRARIQKVQKHYQRSMAQLRAINMKASNRPQAANEDVRMLVDSMMVFGSESAVTLHLMDDPTLAEDMYAHSLNVAVLALMLARSHDYDNNKIRALLTGAVLHDIGTKKVPSAIVRKKERLTDPEMNYYRQHVNYGTELIAEMDECTPDVKIIIEQHHEFANASGFPKGLCGDDIDEVAQIVGMVNFFDRLCRPQFGAPVRMPFAALSHLFKDNKAKFNPRLLALFVKMMGVYPPGTVVKLSNEDVGIIISVNSSALLKPNVMIYDPDIPSDQATIIDMRDSELEIDTAVPISKLPEEVREYLKPRTRISYFMDADG